MKGKWTTVLAAAAFTLAVFGLTPVGNSAKNLIAPNADKVDGIHASKTAKAGMLLPLGKNKQFPAAVVPSVVGPQGPKGDPGPAGDSTVIHIRSVGAVTTGAKNELVPWQLTGASWTQKAGQVDLFYGKFTVAPPVSCATAGRIGSEGEGILTVQVDGVLIGSTLLPHGTSSPVVELRPYLFGDESGGAILAPDVDTTHVLTAAVMDTCEGTNENVTYKSLAIDVISIG